MAGVNERDLDWRTFDRDGTRMRRKQLGAAAGGDDIGASLYELPPGGRSWPYHYHAGNEEALYVLEGTGTLRLAGERVAVEPGDYVALPADESGAHAVENDGDGPLRYLLVSTMRDPDVAVYPDSGKIGVFVGGAPGDREARSRTAYYREDDAVDYWAGEE